MTSRKPPSAPAMMRRFSQKMSDFRGEVEMLDMKIKNLFYDWLEVINIYNEEKKSLHIKHKAKSVLNRKKLLSASADNTSKDKPKKHDFKPSE